MVDEHAHEPASGRQGVFAHAFRSADVGYLDRRFADLATIGLAWRDGRLLGFSAVPANYRTSFALLNFATPVMLRAAFRFGRSSWPGTTTAEVAAAMASPTAAQRAVGQAIADLFGASSYDADHGVMRASQPFGESGADPHDLEPEYGDLFRHVDRGAGDTLLGMFWWSDPPPAWWT